MPLRLGPVSIHKLQSKMPKLILFEHMCFRLNANYLHETKTYRFSAYLLFKKWTSEVIKQYFGENVHVKKQLLQAHSLFSCPEGIARCRCCKHLLHKECANQGHSLTMGRGGLPPQFLTQTRVKVGVGPPLYRSKWPKMILAAWAPTFKCYGQVKNGPKMRYHI